MTRALRYIRVSTEKQRDNSSLETQTDRIDAHCLGNEYESQEDDLFTEVLTGVESWLERPELQRLFRRAEELGEQEEFVVVSDISDRLARGFDLMHAVGLITSLNGRVEFCQEKFEDTE